jgi:hypothetical protein
MNTDTHKEDDRNIEHEGAHTIQEEGEEADMVDLGHGDLGDFPGQGHHEVHGGAHRSEVVNRDQGVHLELGRAQKALDHGKTESLAGDTDKLVNDTNPDKLDLADRGNDNTNDNGGNIEEDLQVRLRHTKNPAGNENSDGSGSLVKVSKTQECSGWDHRWVSKRESTDLEHLDESDAEVQIGEVAADQAQAVEETDRNNGAEVDPASHLDGLPAIQECGIPSKDLGYDSREDQVVGCQDDRVLCAVSAS